VHISDIHYDGPHCAVPRISPPILDQVVQITNQEMPELVCITGDFVECAPEPVELLAKQWLSKLKATYGVYAVLGNHDDKQPHSRSFITKQLALHANIHVLENECVSPMGNKAGNLLLIGFGDFTHKHFHLPPVEKHLLDISKPKVILTHHPDSASLLQNYRADLILAGHTHGGQILFPLVGTPLRYLHKISFLFPSKIFKYLPYVHTLKNWDWIEGLHKLPQQLNYSNEHVFENYLFVNRGLATHPPLRLNCNPEVSIINLVPK